MRHIQTDTCNFACVLLWFHMFGQMYSIFEWDKSRYIKFWSMYSVYANIITYIVLYSNIYIYIYIHTNTYKYKQIYTHIFTYTSIKYAQVSRHSEAMPMWPEPRLRGCVQGLAGPGGSRGAQHQEVKEQSVPWKDRGLKSADRFPWKKWVVC